MSKTFFLTIITCILFMSSLSCDNEDDNIIQNEIDSEGTPYYFENVPAAFNKISENYNRIDAKATTDFHFNLKNQIDPIDMNTHTQGIQRINGTNIFAVSGSRFWWSQGIIGFIRIGSRPQATIIGENAVGGIPDEDTAFHRIVIDEYYFHAGGISLCGNIMAVSITKSTWNIPSENANAMIAFYRFDNDDIESIYEVSRILRPIGDKTNSGAVGITRFPNGKFKDRFLVVNIAWGSGPYDFYISRTTNIRDGFDTFFQRMNVPDGHESAEGLEFLTQTNGDIYLATLQKGQSNLFKVNYSENDNSDEPIIDSIVWTSKKIANLEFTSGDHYYTKIGGFGLYTSPDGELVLYSIRSWTGNDFLGMTDINKQKFTIFEYPSVD